MTTSTNGDTADKSLGDVVNDDGVRMLQSRGDTRLTQCPSPRLVGRPGTQLRLQQQLFHRHRPLQPLVHGLPDDPHAATANPPEHPVVAGDQLTRVDMRSLPLVSPHGRPSTSLVTASPTELRLPPGNRLGAPAH